MLVSDPARLHIFDKTATLVLVLNERATEVWNKLHPVISEIGKSSYGVLAQEVEKVTPFAVTTHESGFKQVNYNMIGVNNG